MLLVWHSIPWYEYIWRAATVIIKKKIDPLIYAAWEYFFDE